mmetsp:Transcript_1534/g.2835  ORF Transcript_1534/g.2835 Transcript_1534/m.2835 type:complete len:340 (-) Transcript_1534:1306-2325(-)
MQLLLDHPDSPYIRGIGFLYLRYVGDPQTVYEWIEPYLYDEEPITVAANAHKNNQRRQQEPETVGDLVRRLFSQRDYYGTMLPRLPIHIERDIQVKLLLAEKIQNRAKKHLSNRKTMDYFQTLGSRVMALYGDEENPTQWYEAVVDRVITRNEETSQPLKTPKFIVTFPEYGNTETVTLGEMEMIGVALDPVTAPTGREAQKDRYESDQRGGGDWSGRGYDRSRGAGNNGHGDTRNHRKGLPTEKDLYDEVRRRERDTVTATGNHAIARRPPTTKTSLAAPARKPSNNYVHEAPSYAAAQGKRPTDSRPSEPSSEPRKRSAKEIAAIQEKKRKLMAKYG